MRLSLHEYISPLLTDGSSKEYVRFVSQYASVLASKNLPVVLSLKHLAVLTQSNFEFLDSIVKREFDPYRVCVHSKRNGGKRYICIPDARLLRVQQWIQKEILRSSFAVSQLRENVTAYVPGKGHLKNAKMHLNADWILSFDLENFFESISERQVYYVFRQLGYRALVAFYFSRLCTRILPRNIDSRIKIRRWRRQQTYRYYFSDVIGHLPQGAPTSPMLANLVCKRLDEDLVNISEQNCFTYSRYSDDLTFSGFVFDRSDIQDLRRSVIEFVVKYGFRLKACKTRLVRANGKKVVTGLSVDGSSLRLPRKYKDKIRQELYYIDKYGVAEHCERIGQINHFSYLRHLLGKVRYVAQVEPVVGQKMLKLFFKNFPDFLEVENVFSK